MKTSSWSSSPLRPASPSQHVREVRDKTREIAASCGSAEADCLHTLIAMTRVRCLAQDLLFKAGLDLTSLRNTALSYFTSGHMPRRLLLQRELPPGVPRAPDRPSRGSAARWLLRAAHALRPSFLRRSLRR